jgi:hypothetical protein
VADDNLRAAVVRILVLGARMLTGALHGFASHDMRRAALPRRRAPVVAINAANAQQSLGHEATEG